MRCQRGRAFSKSGGDREQRPRASANLLGTPGERLLRGPQGTPPAEQVERRLPQQAYHRRPAMRGEHVAIFAEAVVGHVERAVLDPPVAAKQPQQPARIGPLDRQASHQVVCRLLLAPTLEEADPLLDFAHLGHPGEGKVLVQLRVRPDRAPLQAAVSLLDGDYRPREIGNAVRVGEKELAGFVQIRLVFFTRNK